MVRRDKAASAAIEAAAATSTKKKILRSHKKQILAQLSERNNISSDDQTPNKSMENNIESESNKQQSSLSEAILIEDSSDSNDTPSTSNNIHPIHTSNTIRNNDFYVDNIISIDSNSRDPLELENVNGNSQDVLEEIVETEILPYDYYTIDDSSHESNDMVTEEVQIIEENSSNDGSVDDDDDDDDDENGKQTYVVTIEKDSTNSNDSINSNNSNDNCSKQIYIEVSESLNKDEMVRVVTTTTTTKTTAAATTTTAYEQHLSDETISYAECNTNSAPTICNKRQSFGGALKEMNKKIITNNVSMSTQNCQQQIESSVVENEVKVDECISNSKTASGGEINEIPISLLNENDISPQQQQPQPACSTTTTSTAKIDDQPSTKPIFTPKPTRRMTRLLSTMGKELSNLALIEPPNPPPKQLKKKTKKLQNSTTTTAITTTAATTTKTITVNDNNSGNQIIGNIENEQKTQKSGKKLTKLNGMNKKLKKNSATKKSTIITEQAEVAPIEKKTKKLQNKSMDPEKVQLINTAEHDDNADQLGQSIQTETENTDDKPNGKIGNKKKTKTKKLLDKKTKRKTTIYENKCNAKYKKNTKKMECDGEKGVAKKKRVTKKKLAELMDAKHPTNEMGKKSKLKINKKSNDTNELPTVSNTSKEQKQQQQQPLPDHIMALNLLQQLEESRKHHKKSMAMQKHKSNETDTGNSDGCAGGSGNGSGGEQPKSMEQAIKIRTAAERKELKPVGIDDGGAGSDERSLTPDASIPRVRTAAERKEIKLFKENQQISNVAVEHMDTTEDCILKSDQSNLLPINETMDIKREKILTDSINLEVESCSAKLESIKMEKDEFTVDNNCTSKQQQQQQQFDGKIEDIEMQSTIQPEINPMDIIKKERKIEPEEIKQTANAETTETMIRRSGRLKTKTENRRSQGQGLVKDKEKLMYSGLNDHNYMDNQYGSLDSSLMDMNDEVVYYEPRAKSSDELEKERKDLVEGLNQFQQITINEYKCDRIINKEGRKMTCDCFLTQTEIERGEWGCGEDCLNRLLMIECGNRCTVGDRCTNKRFQKIQNSDCTIFKTEKKGFGLRASQMIPAGEFIMEYVGEVLNGQQFENRTNAYWQDKNKHFYFMALHSDCVIDATSRGNISRFINHSCDPNAETQKWTVNGELRIGFFSTRSIFPDEEITFDYQFQRYGKEAQKCFCESDGCRGWIGEQPDTDDEEEMDEDEDDGEDDDEDDEEEEEEAKAESKEDISNNDQLSIELNQQVDKKIIELVSTDAEEESTAATPMNDLISESTTEEDKSESEIMSPVKPKRRGRKKKETPTEKALNRLKTKRSNYSDDAELDKEIANLMKNNLKNQAHTLQFSRLMVRAKLPKAKSQLLQLLQNGELACRRLFLDYHGLKLLYTWMSDSTGSDANAVWTFRMELMKTLELLPIPNKTMIQDSKVMGTIQKWATISECKESRKLPSELLTDNRHHGDNDVSIDDKNVEFSNATNQINRNHHDTKHSDKQKPSEIYLCENPELMEQVHELATKLLVTWNTLTEVFRIPKKLRIEQMKEHEREADMGYNANRAMDTKDTPETEPNKYKWHRNNKIRDGDGKPWDKVRHKYRWQDTNLTRIQRRRLFEAQVAYQQELEMQRIDLERAHTSLCLFFRLDPTKTNASNVPCYVDPTTGQWYSKYQTKIPTPPSHAHIKPPQKLKSTNPNDYHMPYIELPEMWKYAITTYGQIYYYHVKIRFSQWEQPIKLKPLAETNSVAAAAAAAAAPPPPPPSSAAPATASNYQSNPPYYDQSNQSYHGYDYPNNTTVTISENVNDECNDDSSSENSCDSSEEELEASLSELKKSVSEHRKNVQKHLSEEISALAKSSDSTSTSGPSDMVSSSRTSAESNFDHSIESVLSSRRRKRRPKLVQVIMISPRSEEEKSDMRQEMRRYKENKERARRKRDEAKRKSLPNNLPSTKRVAVLTDGLPIVHNRLRRSLDSSLDRKKGNSNDSTVADVVIDDDDDDDDDHADADDKNDVASSGKSDSPYSVTTPNSLETDDNKDDDQIVPLKSNSSTKVVDEFNVNRKVHKTAAALLNDPPRPQKQKQQPSEQDTHEQASKRLKVDGNNEHQKSNSHRTNNKPKTDVSSDEAKRIKDKFRADIAGVIVHHLTPFRKDSCKIGRITNNDDFKHLAKKLTHFVMLKELKHCDNTVHELEVSESVKLKSKEFIRKYMQKFGSVYKKGDNEPEYKL